MYILVLVLLFYSFLLMGAIQVSQIAFLGKIIISSDIIKVCLSLALFLLVLYVICLRKRFRFSMVSFFILFFLFYNFFSAAFNGSESLYSSLSFLVGILIILICSLVSFGSIDHISTNQYFLMFFFQEILFLIFSFFSILEQFTNIPFFSTYLNIPAVGGLHNLQANGFGVFYGWHNEFIPGLNHSIGVFFRSISLFPNALDFGLFLLYSMSFFLCKFFFGRKKLTSNLYGFLFVGLCFFSIFGTHTRVVWISLVFILYYLVIIFRFPFSNKIGFFLGVGVLLQIIMAVVAIYIAYHGESEDGLDSVIMRFQSWLYVFNVLSSSMTSVLFGVGVIENSSNGLILDNTFVALLLFSGCLGLLLFGFLYVLILKRIILVFKINKFKNSNYFSVFLVSTTAVYYVLPFLWFFNNYLSRSVIFILMPVVLLVYKCRLKS